MTLNLTPKRLQALAHIVKHPDIYVGAVAQEVLSQRGPRGLWSQAATRLGAGYCQKLQDAGLITINTRVGCGYGTCRVTSAGLATLLRKAAKQLEKA